MRVQLFIPSYILIVVVIRNSLILQRFCVCLFLADNLSEQSLIRRFASFFATILYRLLLYAFMLCVRLYWPTTIVEWVNYVIIITLPVNAYAVWKLN